MTKMRWIKWIFGAGMTAMGVYWLFAAQVTGIKSGLLQSDLDAGGFKITNSAAPTASSDLATKGYADTAATNLTDAQISGSAAIAKSKIATNSTWAVADIPSLPASQITSGTLDTNRLPTLVKDLGAISGTTGDLYYYDGTHLHRLAVGPEGYVVAISNGVPAYVTNLDGLSITNLTSVTVNATTVKVAGKNVPALHINATNTAPEANIQDTATLHWALTGSSNWTANVQSLPASQITSGTFSTNQLPALVADLGNLAATITTGDLIQYSGTHLVRLPASTSGYVLTANGAGVASTFQAPLIQSIGDGGSGTIKMKNYIALTFPHTCDGSGAIIQTNDNTAKYFGQAAFAGGGAASTNFVEYRLTVPEDIDTTVALKVERFKFRLGAADTAAHSYVLTMASVADSASYDSPSLGNSVTLSFAGDASGASGDVETISSVTLTNWAGALTAGQFWVIRLARDGTDASTQTSYSGPLVISYGSTQ